MNRIIFPGGRTGRPSRRLRTWGKGLAVLASLLLAFVLAAPAEAVVRTVTKTADTNDGTCDGDCSLREALAAAASGDSIIFGVNGTFNLGTGLVMGAGQILTINGNGSGNIILDGGGAVRVFQVPAGSALSLSGVTIRNGFSAGNGAGLEFLGAGLAVFESSFINNQAGGNGGGVSVSAGTGSFTNCTFSSNQSVNGGGVYAANPAVVTVTNCTFYNNTGAGGAYRRDGGATLNLTSTILASSAGGNCSGGCDTQANNLADDGTCFANGASGSMVVAALVDVGIVLALNPWFLTHDLYSDSPAVDAGAGCPPVDQRGVVRPIDGNRNGLATCDIGAVEYVPWWDPWTRESGGGGGGGCFIGTSADPGRP
jgi:CSLREA domain-containing protein